MAANRISVKINGLDEINAKLDELHAKIKETAQAADELFQRTASLEIEINQPSAGTDD